MRSVKLLTDVQDVSRAAGDRWYVTNGVSAVGPVRFDLVARGIEAGKVPLESFIRHEAWTVWRPLAELAVVMSDAPGASASLPTFEDIPDAVPSSGDRITLHDRLAPWRADDAPTDVTSAGAPSFSFEPSPPGSATYVGIPLSELFASTDDITCPGLTQTSPSRPSDDEITIPGHFVPPNPPSLAPSGPFAACVTLEEALLKLLIAAASDVGAEGAIVHQVLDDGAFILCAHGPRSEEMLGRRTALVDPAIVAAASGICVVAEPSPGPAGKAIEARLAELGVEASGALMIPIRLSKLHEGEPESHARPSARALRGGWTAPDSEVPTPARPRAHLFGVLEIGRRQQFLPQEVAEVGKLVDALAARIEDAAWL